MPYTPFYSTWKDWPDVSTPMVAAAMQHIESGITTATSGADSALAASNPGDLVLKSDSGVVGSGDIVFDVGSTERLRFVNGGSIRIGTALNLDSNPNLFYTNKAFVSTGSGNFQSVQIDGTLKGTSASGPASGLRGVVATVQDASGVGNKTVSGAINNGSGLIRLTVTGHGYSTNDSIGVYGVTGTTEANGHWLVTVVDANTIDLQASTFTNAYISGGTTTNRGSAYGIFSVVGAAVDRGGLTGTAADGDDLNVYGAYNKGPGKATTGYLINRNIGNTVDFVYGLEIEAFCDWAIRMTGTYGNYGIDMSLATLGQGAFYMPNNVGFYAVNQAGNARVQLFSCNTLNEIQFFPNSRFSAQVTLQDGANIVLGTTSGTKFGTGATQKIGFYGVTPVAQQNGTGNTTTIAAGSTTSVFTNTTFSGGLGVTGYTVGDVVKALKNIGVLLV